MPPRLTLCRVLVAVTELLDIPAEFLQRAFASGHSLQLHYEFLGRREAIPLESRARLLRRCHHVAKRTVPGLSTERTHTKAKEREEKDRASRDGRRGMVHLPVNYFRYLCM